MGRKSYNQKTKSAAIEAVLQGQEIAFVAQQFDIPHQTLRSWMRRADIKINKVKPSPANADRIGGLLIDVVQAELEGLRSIADMLKDQEWIQSQRADNLAALFAIISDKNMQKIEAMASVPSDDNAS